MTSGEALHVTLYVDGASKGNPGHAGIGVRIETDGTVLKELSDYIGQTTNNAAEYRALILGLRAAGEIGATGVSVHSDSQLMVNQLNGSYRVKTASLLPLYQEARRLAREFDVFRIRHVPRAKNTDADRLANEGILKAVESGKAASG